MSRHFGRMKNTAEIGDIILVAGHSFQEFQVESYTHSLDFEDDYVEEDITYDAADIESGEYLLAFQEDVTVIVKADKADDYIASKSGMSETNNKRPRWTEEIEFTVELKPKEVVPKGDKIDGLLDELSDVNAMIELFGDHEDGDKRDRKYALKACEIKAKLRDIVENSD